MGFDVQPHRERAAFMHLASYARIVMKFIENSLSRKHVAIFAAIWLLFAIVTFFITNAGLDDKGRVLLTTAGTVLGPMTGALARDWQSCCLQFSLGLLPYCGPALIGAVAFQFIPLPLKRGATAIRLTVWTMGLLVWFMGGIVSFGHALS